ncbi:Hint domain-containing protein [Yoonia sp. SS1-5]|uniref:Hint domain-containing protein n=1 Tax=Yoonia rhodophyticola TaxID=3137370 RepID=A0AAN0NK69_9RHOB
MRKYEVAYLTHTGDIAELALMAPATPAFEDSFGALGHGAILQTRNGPMAVEDLLPGDDVRLSNGQFDRLLWRGRMTVLPALSGPDRHNMSLTRVTADALGPQRPAPDVVLGPTARLFHKAPGIRMLTGSAAAYIPAQDFVDGSSFIALSPAAPVNVYQLGFAAHQRLSVNGIEIESLHPGTAFALGLRGEMLAQYLSLFPHKQNLSDFGTLQYPRIRLRDLDLLDSR